MCTNILIYPYSPYHPARCLCGQSLTLPHLPPLIYMPKSSSLSSSGAQNKRKRSQEVSVKALRDVSQSAEGYRSTSVRGIPRGARARRSARWSRLVALGRCSLLLPVGLFVFCCEAVFRWRRGWGSFAGGVGRWAGILVRAAAGITKPLIHSSA